MVRSDGEPRTLEQCHEHEFCRRCLLQLHSFRLLGPRNTYVRNEVFIDRGAHVRVMTGLVAPGVRPAPETE